MSPEGLARSRPKNSKREEHLKNFVSKGIKQYNDNGETAVVAYFMGTHSELGTYTKDELKNVEAHFTAKGLYCKIEHISLQQTRHGLDEYPGGVKNGFSITVDWS